MTPLSALMVDGGAISLGKGNVAGEGKVRVQSDV